MNFLNRAALAEAIEARAKSDLELSNVGGASVLVAQAGEVIYKAHFGSASIGGESVSDDTLFRLASMTKPITAVAAMILVDRGLLSLEDSVARFYPSFSRMRVYESDAEVKEITVKHLLTHTSGIGSGEVWNASLQARTERDVESVERFIAFLSGQPLSFVPGTKQEYSAIGAFSVLTGIIQGITDMPYADFLKQTIFAPCEMKDTAFEPSAEQWRRLIEMHDRQDGRSAVGTTYDGCVFENVPVRNYLGGAGLISSLHDYWNFAQMLLNGGIFHGTRVLSENAVKVLSSPYAFKKEGECWGLGVRVRTEDADTSLPKGAYGWSGAYGTHFWIDPHNQIVGIYMKNSRYDGGSGATTAKHFEADVYSALQMA